MPKSEDISLLVERAKLGEHDRVLVAIVERRLHVDLDHAPETLARIRWGDCRFISIETVLRALDVRRIAFLGPYPPVSDGGRGLILRGG